jgi:hypothetical protein
MHLPPELPVHPHFKNALKIGAVEVDEPGRAADDKGFDKSDLREKWRLPEGHEVRVIEPSGIDILTSVRDLVKTSGLG